MDARILLAAALVVSVGCNKTKLDTLPESHSETHYQGGENQTGVDVVFVIDNSGSMEEEQTKLNNDFQTFIDHFVPQSLDYHLAVITTDVEDPNQSGKFQGSPAFITSDSLDPAADFIARATVGIDGSGAESGLEAVRLAFSEPNLSGQNAGFLRPDAILAVVIVSDEEDFSDGDNGEPNPNQATPVSEYVNFLLALKGGNPAKVLMPVIVGDVPGGCVSPDANAEAGVRYHEAANALNSSKSSICSESFATILDNIGSDVVAFVDSFPLDYTPDPATISVYVDEVLVPPSPTAGWYWDDASGGVAFAPAATPPACAKIEIYYQVTDFGGPIEQGNAEAPPELCPAIPAPTVTGGALEGGYFACTVSSLGNSSASGVLALAGLALASVVRRRRR